MIRIKTLHRVIFCSFWIYFYILRGILGHIRFLDYIAFSLIPIGLLLLVVYYKISYKAVKWIVVLMFPTFIAAIVDPSLYIFTFVIKNYIVALYFFVYFKQMKLTKVELTCFIVPLFFSLYYFVFPTEYQLEYIEVYGRYAGIDEPNFTSLTHIMAICGAFGIYFLSQKKWLKVTSIVLVSISFTSILLTLSRAGIIGALVALYLFLIINLRGFLTNISLGVANLAIIMYINTIRQYLNFLVERFEKIFGKGFVLDLFLNERPFTEYAWHIVQQGPWFVGGGPFRVSESKYYNLVVPHNSLLDIGLGFGKASFYFYGIFLLFVLIINVVHFFKYRKDYIHTSHDKLIASMIFLSLFPMYMFLSSGMTMAFIFWMIMGIYLLIHKNSYYNDRHIIK